VSGKLNMTDQSIMLEGRIGPLAFPIVDQPGIKDQQSQPSLEDILEMLCTPGLERDVNSLVGRWRDISKESNTLFIVPNEERFLERLVWPLRHAKSGYMLGNYLGTIALCGAVAEMLAILLYDIAIVTLGGNHISKKKEKQLFGKKYEKLGQMRRIQVLSALGQIDHEVAVLFDQIRGTRNKYLHLYTQSHDLIAEDAVSTFAKTVSLIVKSLGFGFRDGRFTIRPDLMRYMKKLGIASSVSESTEESSQSHDKAEHAAQQDRGVAEKAD